LFHSPSAQAPAWWNLGGWQNTAHAIQNADVPARRIPGKIETGRWYDIRIDLAGGNIKAFLDGQLIDEATIEPLPTLYAAAGCSSASGEIIVQLVNPFAEPRPVTIRLAGPPSLITLSRPIRCRFCGGAPGK
jgi:alpha-L-arabinofuranosidase